MRQFLFHFFHTLAPRKSFRANLSRAGDKSRTAPLPLQPHKPTGLCGWRPGQPTRYQGSV